MKTIYKRRMLRLARFLDNLPEDKFNIMFFLEEHVKKPPTRKDVEDHVCKTVACAIGWSPVVFPKLLKYKPDRGNSFDIILRDKPKRTNFDAIETVLNLTKSESTSLFAYSGYAYTRPTTTDVANKLRKFVKDKAKA